MNQEDHKPTIIGILMVMDLPLIKCIKRVEFLQLNIIYGSCLVIMCLWCKTFYHSLSNFIMYMDYE